MTPSRAVRRVTAVLTVFTVCAVVTTGCSGGDTSSDQPSDSAGPTAGPDSESASPTTAETRTPREEENADRAAGMSMAQKVGQLFMAGADANDAPAAAYDAISEHHVGNIMLTGRSTAGTAHTRAQVESLRDEVGPRSTHGVRLFVATDQEGGQVQVLRGQGFTDLPSGMEQGDLPAAELRKDAKGWGTELREAGVNVNLAPVMDTVPGPGFAPDNEPIGAFDRQYGYTTKKVAKHGSAFVRGMSSAGVAPVVKHFPGLGRVTANTDTESGVTDDETTRDDPYLEPFAAGIEAGTPFVMVSTASYPELDGDTPAAFSRTIIGSMLRKDLGFDGVVISDDLSNAKQVAHLSPAKRAVEFIAAGGDIVLAVDPTQMPAMTEAVLSKAKKNERFAAKVDAAVERVLAAKAKQRKRQ